MSTNTRILSAGVLTSVIVAVGFASSLLAQSRIRQPSGYQAPVSSQQLIPVRVILPASAEPAQPPQPSTVLPPETSPETQPVKLPAPAVKRMVERAEGLKPTADDRREHRRRYTERKSGMIAAREQMERRPGAGILAFGGDEPRKTGIFGN